MWTEPIKQKYARCLLVRKTAQCDQKQTNIFSRWEKYKQPNAHRTFLRQRYRHSSVHRKIWQINKCKRYSCKRLQRVKLIYQRNDWISHWNWIFVGWPINALSFDLNFNTISHAIVLDYKLQMVLTSIEYRSLSLDIRYRSIDCAWQNSSL